MKHRKKILQYAQDAQVTDTPWEWWEVATRGKEDWEVLKDNPLWHECLKYRRKPQWEIDGKFKIGDRVLVPLLLSEGAELFTVKGFQHPNRVTYYVECVNSKGVVTTFPEHRLMKAPKFKIGDRVTFADLPAVRRHCAALIGQVFTVRGFATTKEAILRVLLKDETRNFGGKGVRQSLLALAPQRLEALSKAVGFDVPMPLQEAPERGTEVFVAFTPLSSKILWHGARSDVDELKANRLHLTAENAEIHAKALAVISSPHFCP